MSKTFNIAVLPGDGTGPEVVEEGVKVMNAAAAKYGFKLNYQYYDFGGDRYLATGEVLPESAPAELKKFDAIFLGAIGHPDVKPGVLEKGILLKLRFELDQYINLRPVKLFPGVPTPLKDKGPKHIDYVVVRENTGGLYTGIGGFTMKDTPDEVAVQSMVYNFKQVERAVRYAFEYTKKRNHKNTLALCGKTNVLTYTYDLWERVFHKVGQADFPDVTREYYHVDATCMWMVKNPEWFDVIVTGNMFGDIITDLGAILQARVETRPARLADELRRVVVVMLANSVYFPRPNGPAIVLANRIYHRVVVKSEALRVMMASVSLVRNVVSLVINKNIIICS